MCITVADHPLHKFCILSGNRKSLKTESHVRQTVPASVNVQSPLLKNRILPCGSSGILSELLSLSTLPSDVAEWLEAANLPRNGGTCAHYSINSFLQETRLRPNPLTCTCHGIQLLNRKEMIEDEESCLEATYSFLEKSIVHLITVNFPKKSWYILEGK